MSEGKYPVNPWSTVEVAIRALPQERFAFCRVSIGNPARDRNPAKGKPLLRQCTDGNFHSGPRVHRIFTPEDQVPEQDQALI